MDKVKNIKIVFHAGDQLQFKYGKEFGFFSNQINELQLIEFCEFVNKELTNSLSYQLFIGKLTNGKKTLSCRNSLKNLEFPIQLFDHSIYFKLNDDEWKKIDEEFFYFVQNKWFQFLELHIDECESYMFNYTI